MFQQIHKYVHMRITCHEEEVCKAHNFLLGPYKEFFCGTDIEFRDSEILALIKPYCDNRILFSLSHPPAYSKVGRKAIRHDSVYS